MNAAGSPQSSHAYRIVGFPMGVFFPSVVGLSLVLERLWLLRSTLRNNVVRLVWSGLRRDSSVTSRLGCRHSSIAKIQEHQPSGISFTERKIFPIERWASLSDRLVLGEPQNKVRHIPEVVGKESSRRLYRNQRDEILLSKHLIHHRPHPVYVLIPNLYKNRPTLTQQIPRNGQPIPQICQIRMNPVPPRIPERLHLLRLAADVLRLAVLHVPARRGPLKVRVELDAVGRVEVDALHLAA